MHASSMMIPTLLFYYGLFLIICGIVAVSFIGMKAKTALASGGTSGVIAIVIGHFISTNTPGAAMAGVVVTLALLVVFSWRSTKTLFTLFELIPARHPDVKGKGIAFLIISLMAVTSLMVLLIQLVHFGH
jgi:hypothetical protein